MLSWAQVVEGGLSCGSGIAIDELGKHSAARYKTLRNLGEGLRPESIRLPTVLTSSEANH